MQKQEKPVMATILSFEEKKRLVDYVSVLISIDQRMQKKHSIKDGRSS